MRRPCGRAGGYLDLDDLVVAGGRAIAFSELIAYRLHRVIAPLRPASRASAERRRPADERLVGEGTSNWIVGVVDGVTARTRLYRPASSRAAWMTGGAGGLGVPRGWPAIRARRRRRRPSRALAARRAAAGFLESGASPRDAVADPAPTEALRLAWARKAPCRVISSLLVGEHDRDRAAAASG